MSETTFTREQDGIDDAEWLDLLDRAGSGKAHFFTENQLYVAYARNKVQVTRYIARRGLWGLALIVIGLAGWVYALKVDWGITLVVGIAVTLSGVAMVGTGVVTRRDPAARAPVTRWLEQWVARHGCERLLTGASLANAGLELAPRSVECVLILERDALVDLFLKNDAHEALCALVVAESGYPRALADEARRLLAERPELQVICAHDATPAGVGLAARLQKSAHFALAGRPVVDAGLFPAEVTWLAELAPAIPAGHTGQVPLDSLSLDALLVGLRGVKRGELSLQPALQHAAERAAELALPTAVEA